MSGAQVGVNVALDAVEAAPVVIAGLQQVAGAVETSMSQHQTVAQTTVGALSALQTTLASPAVASVVGKNDEANIQAGISMAGEAEALGSSIGGLISQIEAFFKKL